MQITVKYNLNDEEDEYLYACHLEAVQMRAALSEVERALRAHEKYDQPPLTRERFAAILADARVNPESL